MSPCLFKLYVEYITRNAGLVKHKLESRLPRKIAMTSDMQMTPLLWPLMKVKEESGKVGSKLNIQKSKIMASGPITS